MTHAEAIVRRSAIDASIPCSLALSRCARALSEHHRALNGAPLPERNRWVESEQGIVRTRRRSRALLLALRLAAMALPDLFASGRSSDTSGAGQDPPRRSVQARVGVEGQSAGRRLAGWARAVTYRAGKLQRAVGSATRRLAGGLAPRGEALASVPRSGHVRAP